MVFIPKYPMLPMEVALKAAVRNTTPWEIFLELKEFTVGQSLKVASVLASARNFAMMGACQGYTMPTKALRKIMKGKLNMTLGKRGVQKRPSTNEPAASAMVMLSLALAKETLDAAQVRL